jgi:hypothetical protein
MWGRTTGDDAWAGEDERPRERRRSRTARVAAAGVAAALAVTGVVTATASAMAATSTSPSWQIVKRVHSGSAGVFTAVVAVGKTGGWAFNGVSGPTAWKRSGSSWTQVAFPGLSDERVVAAGASSPTNVWAFTDGGTTARALRWNGSRWSVMRSFGNEIGGAVVLSRSDVWVFGEPVFPGEGLGSWHYNGHAWSKASSGHGLEGGSGLSARDVWAFAGTKVAHWNGSTWARTSVANLLPAKQALNDPAVVGIVAESPGSVYAIGSGNREDEGGPTVILHYNGHVWRKVAGGSFGIGTFPLQQATSDGHGGLWIPMPGFDTQKSFMVHYRDGKLTKAALPGGAARIDVVSVARIPGTAQVLGGGFTHTAGQPSQGIVSVILQYGG